MPVTPRRAVPLLAALILAAAPAVAQQSSAVFDLSLRGIRAATLSVSGNETASGYAVSGRLESAGIVGLFRTMRYDATVQGTLGRNFSPARYTEDADTGKRKSRAVLRYVNGVPEIVEYSPPRDARDKPVDPAQQRGTIDPLTAIWIGLRPTSTAEVCDHDSYMFDGKRRSRVGLSNPRKQGDTILCTGRYERIEGFSDREMAEKRVFNFTMTYVPAGEGKMQVREMSMDTLYGAAVLRRR